MYHFPELFKEHYEYLLKEVLESINDAVLVFDHKHTIAYANDAASTVFSMPKNGLVGINMKRLIPKDRIEDFTAVISGLDASEHHEVQLQGKKEFIGLRASRHFFYAEGKLAKFKGESAYILVLRDSTWRKAVEGELEVALAHLKVVGRKVAYRVEHPSILDEFPLD
jgi:PAS domain S-box-containing protein